MLTFFHHDHLGSTRMITNEDGGVVSTHDYAAYGEEMTPTDYDETRMKFTGHERDPETELDYMMARYYSSNFGRFLQVDPGYDYDTMDPMSWNLYGYVRWNPVKFVDLTGLSIEEAALLYSRYITRNMQGVSLAPNSVEYSFTLGSYFNYKEGYEMRFPHNRLTGKEGSLHRYKASRGDVFWMHTHPDYESGEPGSVFSPNDVYSIVKDGHERFGIQYNFAVASNKVYAMDIANGTDLSGFDSDQYREDFVEAFDQIEKIKGLTFQEKTELAMISALDKQNMRGLIHIYVMDKESGEWICLY